MTRQVSPEQLMAENKELRELQRKTYNLQLTWMNIARENEDRRVLAEAELKRFREEYDRLQSDLRDIPDEDDIRKLLGFMNECVLTMKLLSICRSTDMIERADRLSREWQDINGGF
jgi:hypothetical protein